MTLSFPTLAEQAVAEFEARTKTASLSAIAQHMGASRDDTDHRVFVFDDDTTLHISGAGRAHKYWTELP